MKYVIVYFKRYRKPFLFALFFLLIEAFSDLLQPMLMSKLVDEGIKTGDLNYIIKSLVYMLIITFVGLAAALGRNYLASTVSQNLGRDLRLDVFTKVHNLSADSVDKIENGSLITRLTNDITQIQRFSFGLMRIFVKAPVLCIGAIIMMFFLNAQLALVLVAIIPIAILIISLSIKIGYPYFLRVQTALDKVNSVLREYLSGVRVVKAFNRFSHEQKRFKKANDVLANTTKKTMQVLAFFGPSIALIVNLGIVVIFYISGFYFEAGSIEVGQIMAFVVYMTQVLMALSMMSNIFNMFVRSKASSDRVAEILDADIAKGLSNEIMNDYYDKGVEFKDVSFHYEGAAGTPVIKNLSFSCSPGETVGIIGSTGAGKSTLFHLLLRFYDVTSGSILVDGIDVKDYNISELREKIAVVQQKNILFSGTIFDNLHFGNDQASMEEIREACKIACCDDFISGFQNGYQTILGQGGVNLSGGQKQRVCIARALVKKAPILILDDSTSAVDVRTEASIREGLNKYGKDSITFIVSSRISSVVTCSKILVLENGELVGYGKHKELMNDCEVYQDIYQSQIGIDGENYE